MENFQKLKVFQKAHILVLDVYKITKDFPSDEKFGLVSQMRRAAVSVVANIAESTKRKSNKDRNHFHAIAQGSLEELKYYFILSADLEYISQERSTNLISKSREIGAMLNGLIKSLEPQSLQLIALRLTALQLLQGCK
jgi:four helix bundle protein